MNTLTTPFEKDAILNWEEYPRPQMRRTSYKSLCGKWRLSLLQGENIFPLGDITVPYPPESRISGIERSLLPEDKYI